MVRRVIAILVCVFAFSAICSAQFKEEAFTQTYADPNDTSGRDTSAVMFSLKNYYRGLRHQEKVKIGAMFGGSAVFVGGMQVYNRQAWKLPVVYGGLAATVGTGIHYRKQFTSSLDAYRAAYELDPNTTLTIDRKAQHMSNYLFAGAAAIWWGSLLDGVMNWETDRYPDPGKATIYSILCPGLGQIYNHEYWKLPIYWGGLIGSFHFYQLNKTNYTKYRDIYNQAMDPESGYNGPIPGETALYYRNVFRRYRDYSTLAIAAVYILQIIDADVFSYMQDFEMTDDLTMSVSPTVITPDTSLAFISPQSTGVGLRIGFRF